MSSTDPVDQVVDALSEQDLLELDQLALERTKRKETIEAETERVKAIDAILRDRLPAGTTTTGACKVTIARGRQTVNADRFAAAFPAGAFPEAYRTSPRPLSELKELLGSLSLQRAGVVDDGTPTVQVR